jgi:hypothetical protein
MRVKLVRMGISPQYEKAVQKLKNPNSFHGNTTKRRALCNTQPDFEQLRSQTAAIKRRFSKTEVSGILIFVSTA